MRGGVGRLARVDSEEENRGAARRGTEGPIRVEHVRQPQAASHRHPIAGLSRLLVMKRPAIGNLSSSPSSLHTFLAAPSFSMLLPGQGLGKTLDDSEDGGMSVLDQCWPA